MITKTSRLKQKCILYLVSRNAFQNRIGRLMLREDGCGAVEYFYGKMGEVTKTMRTLIVPNQAVATYVTQWKYDSHNRLLEMIYPDEEKVTYDYNLGGQVDHVRGYKSYGYDYVNSEFSGGNTGTARFSLYVSPYLVAGQGSKHTKHILHFRAGRKSFPE